MEIQKLQIKNIASIEEAEIDFSGEILGGSHLMLICGPTGAGKSTIMDAICLALYKNTPRINSTKISQRYADDNTRFADAKDNTLGVHDTRHLMRKGTGLASAKLRFIGNNDDLYEAEWTVRKNRNGKINKPEWTWTNITKGVTIAKDRDIEEEAQSAIGLNFEQFCRASMLAQGEFDKFITSDDNDKAEILEKLTDTADFACLSRAIYQKYADKVRDLDLVRAAVETDSANLLTDVQVEEMTKELESIGKKSESLQIEKKMLDELSGNLHNLQSAYSDMEKLTAERNESVARLKSDKYQEQHRIADLWDRTVVVRGLKSDIDDLNTRLAGTLSLEVAKRQEFVRLSAGLKFSEQWLKEKEADLEDCKRRNEQEKIHSSAYDNAEAVKNDLENLSELRKELLLQDLQKMDKSTNLSHFRPDEAGFAAMVDVAGNYTRLVSELYLEIGQLANSNVVEDLSNHSTLLKNKQLALTQVLPSVERYNETKLSVAEKIESRRLLLEKKQILSSDLAKAEEAVAAVRKRLAEADELKGKISLSLNDLMCETRSKLSKGDKCPLCGHLIEDVGTLPSDEDFQSVLKPLEEQIYDIKIKEKTLVEKCGNVSAELYSVEHILAQLDKDIEKDEAVLADCEEKIKTSDFGSGFSGGNSIELQRTLRTNADTLRLKISKVESLFQKYKRFASVAKDVEKLNDSYASIYSDMARKSDQAVAVFGRLSRKMDSFTSWRDEFAFDTKGFVQKFDEESARYKSLGETILKTETNIAKARDAVDRMQSMREKILEIFPQWAEEQIPYPQKTENALQLWSQLQSEVQNLSAGRVLLSRQLQDKRQAFDAAILSANIEVRDMEVVMGYSQESIVEIKNSHKLLEDKLLQIETLIEEKKNNIAGLQRNCAGHDVSEISVLQQRREVCDIAMKELQETAADLKSGLRRHGELLENLKGRKELLEKKQNDCAKWKKYNEMFGSYDGAKFRKIAQGYVFKELLDNANYYLGMMGKRYSMKPDGLIALVQDNYEGGSIRPVHTVSGGEKFIISLSLALALSRMRGHGQVCDMLFIDEGFGTLSRDNYLNVVIECLQRLHYVSGQRVVIISHVESLRERIPVQIRVRPVDATSSRVDVVG